MERFEEISEGFVYNEAEGKGLFGLNGRLTIQPEYQRNYIYADGKKDKAVIVSKLPVATRNAQDEKLSFKFDTIMYRSIEL